MQQGRHGGQPSPQSSPQAPPSPAAAASPAACSASSADAGATGNVVGKARGARAKSVSAAEEKMRKKTLASLAKAKVRDDFSKDPNTIGNDVEEVYRRAIDGMPTSSRRPRGWPASARSRRGRSAGGRSKIEWLGDLPQVGCRIELTIDGIRLHGVCAFIGRTDFASGEWVGAVLRGPLGRNDGSVNGVRYFSCKAFHGVFVRPWKILRVQEQAEEESIDEVEAEPAPTRQWSNSIWAPEHGWEAEPSSTYQSSDLNRTPRGRGARGRGAEPSPTNQRFDSIWGQLSDRELEVIEEDDGFYEEVQELLTQKLRGYGLQEPLPEQEVSSRKQADILAWDDVDEDEVMEWTDTDAGADADCGTCASSASTTPPPCRSVAKPRRPKSSKGAATPRRPGSLKGAAEAPGREDGEDSAAPAGQPRIPVLVLRSASRLEGMARESALQSHGAAKRSASWAGVSGRPPQQQRQQEREAGSACAGPANESGQHMQPEVTALHEQVSEMRAAQAGSACAGLANEPAQHIQPEVAALHEQVSEMRAAQAGSAWAGLANEPAQHIQPEVAALHEQVSEMRAAQEERFANLENTFAENMHAREVQLAEAERMREEKFANLERALAEKLSACEAELADAEGRCAELEGEAQRMTVAQEHLADIERTSAEKLRASEEQLAAALQRCSDSDEEIQRMIRDKELVVDLERTTAEKLHASEEQLAAALQRCSESDEEVQRLIRDKELSVDLERTTAEKLRASEEQLAAALQRCSESDEEVQRMIRDKEHMADLERTSAEKLRACEEQLAEALQRCSESDEEVIRAQEHMADLERTSAEKLHACEEQLAEALQQCSESDEEVQRMIRAGVKHYVSRLVHRSCESERASELHIMSQELADLMIAHKEYQTLSEEQRAETRERGAALDGYVQELQKRAQVFLSAEASGERVPVARKSAKKEVAFDAPGQAPQKEGNQAPQLDGNPPGGQAADTVKKKGGIVKNIGKAVKKMFTGGNDKKKKKSVTSAKRASVAKRQSVKRASIAKRQSIIKRQSLKKRRSTVTAPVPPRSAQADVVQTELSNLYREVQLLNESQEAEARQAEAPENPTQKMVQAAERLVQKLLEDQAPGFIGRRG